MSCVATCPHICLNARVDMPVRDLVWPDRAKSQHSTEKATPLFCAGEARAGLLQQAHVGYGARSLAMYVRLSPIAETRRMCSREWCCVGSLLCSVAQTTILVCRPVDRCAACNLLTSCFVCVGKLVNSQVRKKESD